MEIILHNGIRIRIRTYVYNAMHAAPWPARRARARTDPERRPSSLEAPRHACVTYHVHLLTLIFRILKN